MPSFTVKDIFNTYTFPTEMGSPLWKNFKAGNNARVISSILNAGYNFLGKTVTSEFAVHSETKTLNPLDKNRITGTSSSGSAVSVLLGESDISLATQSGASISRPAAYCGVLGFKPTFGLIPRTGILKTCDPFDTVGFFLNDLDIGLETLKSVALLGTNYPQNSLTKYSSLNKIGYFEEDDLKSIVDISPDMIKTYINFIKKISSKGLDVKPIKTPEYFSSIHKSHHVIYTKSLEYYFKNELKEKRKVSEKFMEFIESGQNYSKNDFIKEINNHPIYISSFDDFLSSSDVDLIITPAVNGIAPEVGNKEIDDLSLFWTYLHVPCLTAPVAKDSSEMPMSLNFVSPKNTDRTLLEFVKTNFYELILKIKVDNF
jgi:Asp-tRNA(Asn)/Glu-tRNA(Gln) amidotransferase A subunit family amidase